LLHREEKAKFIEYRLQCTKDGIYLKFDHEKVLKILTAVGPSTLIKGTFGKTTVPSEMAYT
jgi:hypothetical protein